MGSKSLSRRRYAKDASATGGGATFPARSATAAAADAAHGFSPAFRAPRTRSSRAEAYPTAAAGWAHIHHASRPIAGAVTRLHHRFSISCYLQGLPFESACLQCLTMCSVKASSDYANFTIAPAVQCEGFLRLCQPYCSTSRAVCCHMPWWCSLVMLQSRGRTCSSSWARGQCNCRHICSSRGRDKGRSTHSSSSSSRGPPSSREGRSRSSCSRSTCRACLL